MKKLIKFIFLGFVGLFVLVLLIGIFADPVPSDDQTSEVANDGDGGEEIIAINSEDLASVYEENEVAANKYFRGKLLKVTGTVVGIDSDFSNKAVVVLSGINSFQNVRASGDAAFDNYASTLSKGQNISLICRGAGEVIGSPALSNCQPE